MPRRRVADVPRAVGRTGPTGRQLSDQGQQAERGQPTLKEVRTTLVARQVDGTVQGSADFDFLLEGLVVRLTVPIDGADIATARLAESEI